MSRLRGGSWSAGFWSGATGTALAPLAETGNYYGNVASNAVIGGTISEVTGGKFTNGAAFGAFRYMFNDALHTTYPKKDEMLRVTESKRWVYDNNGSYKTMVVNGRDIGQQLYGTYRYFNGHAPRERFVYGMGRFASKSLYFFVVEHGDGFGLVLSVGAAVFEGPFAVAMGLGAIGLDVYQGDEWGKYIGVTAFVADTYIDNKYVKIGALGADIGYGIWQVIK